MRMGKVELSTALTPGIPFEEEPTSPDTPDNSATVSLPELPAVQPTTQDLPTPLPQAPSSPLESQQETKKKPRKVRLQPTISRFGLTCICKLPPSAVVEQWLPYERDIIRALLSREANPLILKDDNKCSVDKCKRYTDMRCLDCGAREPICEPCAVTTHKHLYYHRLDRWIGKRFERVELCELGFIIHLGHRDHPCPNIPKGETPKKFIITHSNGVHNARVHYCHCTKNGCGPLPEFVQLISAGLWPSTLLRPATAFSEAFMKMWHLDWNISHKSSQDYFRVFVRLTNNYDALSVPVRLLPMRPTPALMLMPNHRIDTASLWYHPGCGATSLWSNDLAGITILFLRTVILSV